LRPFFGYRVKLGFAAGVGVSPLRLEPAAIFETMERWIERALMHGEEILGDLAQALSDGMTVAGTQGDDLEDQHIESAAEEFGFGFVHCDT